MCIQEFSISVHKETVQYMPRKLLVNILWEVQVLLYHPYYLVGVAKEAPFLRTAFAD